MKCLSVIFHISFSKFGIDTHFALPCSCRQNANEIDVWGLTWVRRMLHYIKFWLFVKIVQCNITLIDRRLVLQYTYIFELILTDLFELKEQPQPHAEIRVILWEITGKSCRFFMFVACWTRISIVSIVNLVGKGTGDDIKAHTKVMFFSNDEDWSITDGAFRNVEFIVFHKSQKAAPGYRFVNFMWPRVRFIFISIYIYSVHLYVCLTFIESFIHLFN